jgi:hypothetical protein
MMPINLFAGSRVGREVLQAKGPHCPSPQTWFFQKRTTFRLLFDVLKLLNPGIEMAILLKLPGVNAGEVSTVDRIVKEEPLLDLILANAHNGQEIHQHLLAEIVREI